jgi:flavin reductase (NADH)
MEPVPLTGSAKSTEAGADPQASADDYKELMSRFPTGVCIVTSTDADRRPHGLTCSSLSSVSVVPPTLLVCLKMSGPTLAALQWRRRFAVNVLHSRARMAAAVFSAPIPHRFSAVRWRPSPRCELPWLDADSLGLAECGLISEVPAGDHVVVVGEVLSVTLSGGVPLLYGMRRYSAWSAYDGSGAAGRSTPCPGFERTIGLPGGMVEDGVAGGGDGRAGRGIRCDGCTAYAIGLPRPARRCGRDHPRA